MSSRHVQWRRFAFFEKETLIEDIYSEIGANVTCIACRDNRVAVGDDMGKVTISLGNFEKRNISRATVFNGRVDSVYFSGDLFWAVGNETTADRQMFTIVKAWSALPLEVPSISINTSVHHEGPAALLSFSVSTDNSQVACGFADGSVLIYHAVTIEDSGASLIPKLIKPSSPHPSGISALHFCHRSDQTYLFICREEKSDSLHEPGEGITCVNINAVNNPVVLDVRGCKFGCAAYNDDTKELLVGREDGVYFYSPEDRGAAAGFEGEKEAVGCFSKGYVLVSSVDRRNRKTSINIYDLQNKFVAFHSQLPNDVSVSFVACRGMWEEGANNIAFVVTTKGSLMMLKERDITSKLELLYKKNLYPIAITLAYSNDLNPGEIMEIYRMYGDHLYRKGDYAGAVQQYQHTIGHVEPSFVIQKYLDAQRIPFLTQYLEALHSDGVATANHTTLLLNCYTKLKDEAKLNNFILGKEDTDESSDSKSEKNHIRIIDPTSEQAAKLARRHKAHEWFVRIQLERVEKNYQSTLDYISNLSLPLAETFMTKYGKALVSNLPEESTVLLVALCTGKVKNLNEVNAKSCLPEDFIHLFVDHPKWLRIFLELMVKETRSYRPSAAVCNTLLELLLREWGRIAEDSTFQDDIERIHERRRVEEKIMNLLNNPNLQYDVDHALVLSLMLEFKPGQLFLYEKLNMTTLILEHYINTGDTKSMIDVCVREGAKSPGLWVTILTHLVNRQPPQDSVFDSRWGDIEKVLGLLAKDPVLLPMEVLTILSKNSELPFWVARNFMKNHLSRCLVALKKNEKDIEEFRKNTNQMRSEISVLRSSSKIISAVNYSRSQEDGKLNQVPTAGTRLMCYPLSPLTSKVPTVGQYNGDGGEYEKYDGIKKTQLKLANNHEQFYKDIEEATDGFSQIAEYFGKGIIPGAIAEST